MPYGDHLKVNRRFYYHHGIECKRENGVVQVIHLAINNKRFLLINKLLNIFDAFTIQKSSINKFESDPLKIKVVNYRQDNVLQAEIVVKRAEEFYKKYNFYKNTPEFERLKKIYTRKISKGDAIDFLNSINQFDIYNFIIPYHLVKFNCEHFATYIKTGEFKSTQITNNLIVWGIYYIFKIIFKLFNFIRRNSNRLFLGLGFILVYAIVETIFKSPSSLPLAIVVCGIIFILFLLVSRLLYSITLFFFKVADYCDPRTSKGFEIIEKILKQIANGYGIDILSDIQGNTESSRDSDIDSDNNVDFDNNDLFNFDDSPDFNDSFDINDSDDD